MAKLNPNSLRPEERISGFELTDSETFFTLDNYEQYPGNLPNFDHFFDEDDNPEPEIIEPVVEKELSPEQAEIETIIENSVWDVFNGDKDEPADDNQDQAGKSEYLFLDETENEIEEIQEIDQQSHEDELNQLIQNDLKELLSKDVKAAQMKKEQTAMADFLIAKQIEQQESVRDTDNNAEETFIDLSILEADKPSRYGLEKTEETPPPKPERVTVKKKVKEPKVKKPKTEKKSRKLLFLIIALLLIAATAAYFAFFNKPLYQKIITSILGSKKDTTEKIASNLPSSTFTQKPAVKVVKPKADTAKPIIKVVTPKPEPRKPEPKKPEPKIEKPKEIKKVEPKPVQEKPKKIEKPKPVIEKKIQKEQAKEKVKPSIPEVDKEFTVQVYSTPYKDDAEEWLKYLQKKGVTGFVTEQKIRDKRWFRVRFGAFKTYNEAKSAALSLGFEQSWVDRVK
ncbi:MAG: SPOR domain-containing protein [Candidatus Kapabacteria bacterium]|nr:SPOR domain-containing protein [Candidatus Kapabacteria bacterium]